MLAGATQTHRIAELKTPLGPDKLLLTSFTAHEELSSPFEIRVEAVSQDENIDFGAGLGKNCSIRHNTPGNKTRWFSGVMVETAWIGETQAQNEYEIVLRPWLWLLTQASENRIFQKMTAPDIIMKVFKDLGFLDFESKLTESYPKLDYCVQYQESHFAFVSRLMEKFGIYYFFNHTESKHILVLADGRGSHQSIPDLPQCRFVSTGEQLREPEETLSGWHSTRRFRTGKVTVNAYDFDKPSANLLHSQSQKGGYANDGLEHYQNTDKYKQEQVSDLAQKYAKTMLQSRQAEDQRRNAEGDAPSLFPGGLVTVFGQLNPNETKGYLVVSASHAFVREGYSSGRGGGQDNSYHGQYVLQPGDKPFKAPLVTPRPQMSGPQTATVVGPSGEEIYTDKHGRIKIQFHWDREGKRDENSSRWARVAQVWSGKGWGGQFLPRIGMEVVVDFIDGDPDRPLVVGTVYNGKNTVPYELPANQTQSGLKSRSSKGGSGDNYNEFMFEDKKGVEFVRLQAEKDLKIEIEDKETRVIKGKNKAAKGLKTKVMDVEPDATTREMTIEKGDDVLDVKTGNKKTGVGNDYLLDVKQNILIKAGESITLECGKSKIVMKPGTITIDTGTLTTTTKMATKIDGGNLIEQKAGMIKLN